MRIILYKWGGFNEDILENKLKALGNEVFVLEMECRDFNSDMVLAQEIITTVHSQNAEALISFNFFPIVAAACNAIGILYYSWIYDSPHFTLYSDAVKYDTNRIGVFDNALVEELKSKGVKTCFHLPIAVDIGTFDRRMGRQNGKEFKYDISFVGSLYTDKRKNTYYDDFKADANYCNDKTQESWEYYDECVRLQAFCYDKDFIIDNENLDYFLLEKYMSDIGAVLGPDYFASQRQIVINEVLERKVTSFERRRALCEIANHVSKNRFGLFTNSDTSFDSKLNDANKGTTDYITGMPQVFGQSMINFNIALRSIRSGIPLRALDILGCGGFLLSSPQTELKEEFDIGKEAEVFESLEECLDKIRFYIDEAEIRNKIAMAGRKKVSELYSYERLLPLLLTK